MVKVGPKHFRNILHIMPSEPQNVFFSCHQQSDTFNIDGRAYALRPVTRTLSPLRETRGTGREIRTVDLGNVADVSHEAERELREMTDDTSTANTS